MVVGGCRRLRLMRRTASVSGGMTFGRNIGGWRSCARFPECRVQCVHGDGDRARAGGHCAQLRLRDPAVLVGCLIGRI